MRDSRICYDIYALARERTRALIDQFIDTYIDLSASEGQDQAEFMVTPLEDEGPVSNLPDDLAEWPPYLTMSRIIDAGLTRPPHAFLTERWRC